MTMTTFTVHLARTGERQQVAAQDWRSALKATGRLFRAGASTGQPATDQHHLALVAHRAARAQRQPEEVRPWMTS